MSFPFFEKASTRDDNHVLCGAIVSGPYTDSGGGTDKYTNNRRMWVESEAALDYSGAIACAFGGYAAMPASDLSSCKSRTPFTGRSGGSAPRSKPAPKKPAPKRKPAPQKPAPQRKSSRRQPSPSRQRRGR